MGINASYFLNWCPTTDNIHNIEHTYVPLNQHSDITHDLIKQHLCTVQSDMKHLGIRLQHAEEKIVILTQQQIDMTDTDMVFVRS